MDSTDSDPLTPTTPTPAERERALGDPFAAHEALDRADLAATFFDEHVYTHHYVRSHPNLAPAADRLMDALADFYQLVGRNQPE